MQVLIDKDGILRWKEDPFIIDLMANGMLNIDFNLLIANPSLQELRKKLYKRIGYPIQKYFEAFS
jgi:hypothetical protein